MTQVTQDQRVRLQDAAARLTERLQGLYEVLPDDEQLVLDVGLSLLLDGNPDLGLEGYAIADPVNPWPYFRDYLRGEGLDYALAAVGAPRRGRV
jgi:hypothetical protein